jgi:hypothetical protein
MGSVLKSVRRRALRASLLLSLLATMAVAAWPGGAQAGTYHVYSCRTPSGESAPTDGWSGSKSGEETYVEDTCSQPNGSLMAALGDGVPREADSDIATWTFGVPPGDRLTAATLWRAGDADGSANPYAGYEIWFAGPENNLTNPAEYFAQCEGGSRCPKGVGTTSEPLAAINSLVVPEANLGPHLYMSASCVGSPAHACTEGMGDSNFYAAAVYLYAADLTLEQGAGPSASGVGGELVSSPTVGGMSDVTFSASDPGAGVYEAVFSVDGQVVQRSVVNENGGRCRNVGQTSDGSLAFLYLQPCLGSVSGDVGLDTTEIANGAHHLVVSVEDAAGNSAPVLDREITVYNPPPPGAPNGINASSQATLSARWKSTTRASITSDFGRSHTVTGRLTTTAGVPITGAQIEVLATPSSAGTAAVTMRSPTTDGQGRFALSLPRNLSSRGLRFIYRAHLGDPTTAATGTLTLRVRAAIALRVSPRTASVGSSIRFQGHLRGGPVPAEGKQLVLEARSPGGPWIEFQVVRTNSRGAFHASYRFKFPGPAVYQFRVRSEPESDYPYAAGASNRVTVQEH